MRNGQLELLRQICGRKGVEQLLTGKILKVKWAEEGKEEHTLIDWEDWYKTKCWDLIQMADEREYWETMIVNVCNHVQNSNWAKSRMMPVINILQGVVRAFMTILLLLTNCSLTVSSPHDNASCWVWVLIKNCFLVQWDKFANYARTILTFALEKLEIDN